MNKKVIDEKANKAGDTINAMIRLKQQAQKKASTQKHVESRNRIKIGDIIDNPFQPRLKYDEEYINGLAISINRDGLLQPILVTPRDGKYVLVAGHQRKIAHEILNKEYIDAIVREELNDEELMIFAGIENIKRRDLSVVEEGKYYYDLSKNGFSINEIAERFGEDPTTVGRKKNLIQLSENILEDIRTNKSTSDVNALSILRKIADESKQVELYNGFLKNDREWLKKEIEILQSEHVQIVEAPYSIKKNKMTIDLKKISAEKAKKIEDAIKNILSL